jgi:aminopeptidase YwaD
MASPRRRTCILTLLSAAFLATGLAIPHAAAIDDGKKLSADANAYQQLVEYLAGPETLGRGPGTPGIDKARDFIAGHFRRIGLAPGAGKSYLQEFPLRLGGKVKKLEVSVCPADANAIRLTPGTDVGPLMLKESCTFEGEVVFCGYGISDESREYDSYAKAKKGSLEGKVLVVLRYEPHDSNGTSLWAGRRTRYSGWTGNASLARKLSVAAKHKPEALIVVNPPAHNTGNRPTIPDILPYRSPSHVPLLQADLDWFRKLCKRQGKDFAALKKAADKGGDTPVPLGATAKGEMKIATHSVKCHNVVAVLKGAGKLADEVVLVGAHYDHLGSGSRGKDKPLKVFPGADDNASGTAGVMVLAERMVRWSQRKPGPRRTIIFTAFSAEERGLVGSRYMADHLKQLGIEPEQVTAMLNFDMIGRLRNGRLSVWGVDSGDAWREILAEHSPSSGLSLAMIGSGIGPSDHASFYRKQIPVLAFNTGGHADLHRPGDTPDKIKPVGALAVLDFAQNVLTETAIRKKAVEYRPPRKKGDAYLGVMCANGEDGCSITTVTEGSPAGKDGLKVDDVIVSCDGKKIGGTFDLISMLRKRKPGDVVSVTVLRDGEKKIVKVTLGSR